MRLWPLGLGLDSGTHGMALAWHCLLMYGIKIVEYLLCRSFVTKELVSVYLVGSKDKHRHGHYWVRWISTEMSRMTIQYATDTAGCWTSTECLEWRFNMKNTQTHVRVCSRILLYDHRDVAPILSTMKVTSDTWLAQAARQAVSHGRCCNRLLLSTHMFSLWSPKGNANDSLALYDSSWSILLALRPEKKRYQTINISWRPTKRGCNVNVVRSFSLFVSKWREQLGGSQQ